MNDIRIAITDKRMGRRFRRAAFTLVELSIVLLIIAILTVATVPTLADSLAHHRVEAAAQRIAIDLRRAQTRARMKSADQEIDFSTASSSYTMPGVPDLDHPGQDYHVDLDRAPYNVLLTYVSFSSSDLQFNGFGVPDQSGEIDIEVSGQVRTVLLSTTGQVTIQ